MTPTTSAPRRCCPQCFDAAPSSYECVDLLDAKAKTGYSVRTWLRWTDAGLCMAKRVANGTGKWMVLIDARGLPVDPPAWCPHERAAVPTRGGPPRPPRPRRRS